MFESFDDDIKRNMDAFHAPQSTADDIFTVDFEDPKVLRLRMDWRFQENLTFRGGDRMAGRNNKPDNDGSASNPSRLDQFGDQLGSRNEEEFRSAVEEACESDEDKEQ